MIYAPTLWDSRRGSIQDRYEEWLRTPDGRLVYDEVRLRAMTLYRRGWTHFGIGAIWEAVRYDRAVRVGPEDGFKLNDHYRSRLARDLMADWPELAGFFETRELRA